MCGNHFVCGEHPFSNTNRIMWFVEDYTIDTENSALCFATRSLFFSVRIAHMLFVLRHLRYQCLTQTTGIT